MAVFFRLHFAYRIQGYRICAGGRLGPRWTRKQRIIAGIGWVLGVGTAAVTIKLLIYLVNLTPWPWLRKLLGVVLLLVSYIWWLWPTVLVIAVFLNFYCAMTKEDPGHDICWMLLLPPIRRRVIRTHAD